ncbi:MAG: HD domain-containing protein [Treponema sp.]|jgi:GTP pyrophosphokinase|nr:HD domain-containing protein [Treponema sp.]
MRINGLPFDVDTAGPGELIARFLKTFPAYTGDDERRIREAWDFLWESADALSDADDSRWYLHPLCTAVILAESKLDADTIMAALLHGLPAALPDKNAAIEAMEEKFGPDVGRILTGVGRITGINLGGRKAAGKPLYHPGAIQKMLFALADDVRIILLKLADRLDRLRGAGLLTPEEQKSLGQEAEEVWAPLANRLGMSALKTEFEDLSLKFTNPEVYSQIKKIVALKKDDRTEYLGRAEKEILRAAAKANIPVSVSSRAKHFYSIYKKMQKRNVAADGLYDLLAIRIITPAPADCYTLVGLVHGLWRPLDGHFKDYIARPKSNGYQSLHTAVLFEGKPLEIQIRTGDMHRRAEYGVASHWLYKKQTLGGTTSRAEGAIISRLKELKQEGFTSGEPFNEIRKELLGNSIFVFTPKGDVVELPDGSTAIDFAYAIHSAVGEKIVGAKAGGQIIPLASPLKNTQIIEILTTPQAHPTVNQLNIVKTAKARSKIRAWLQQNDPLFTEKPAVKPTEAEPRRAHKPGDGPETPGQRSLPQVCIGNTTNFLVTFAKCCAPAPGDPIVGYVSRGRGVIVHRDNCRAFHRIPNYQALSVEAGWVSE